MSMLIPVTHTNISRSDFFHGHSHIMKKVSDLLGAKMFCDVTLISNTGDCKIDAHKIVLSAASQYFLRMFSTPMKESYKRDVTVHMDGETLKSVIEYIYTDSIELTPETVEDVLKAADLFDITTLKVICSEFMAQQLDLSNCLGFSAFAEHYSLERLYDISEELACKNFMQVCDEVEFLELDVEQLSKLLSYNNLNVSSEEDVFRILLSWIQHDELERNKHMEKLLRHLRFQQLSTKFISNEIDKRCKTFGSRELLLEAYKWHSLPKIDRLIAVQQMPRLTRGMLIAICGLEGNGCSLNVGMLYPGARKWIYNSCSGLLVGRTKFASVVFEDKLFIAGGILANTHEVTNSVYCLNFKTFKWTSRIASLTTPRHSFKMAAFGGCIYAVGGINGDKWINTLEKWDPSTNQWSNEGYFDKSPEDFQTNLDCVHVCASSNLLYVLIRFYKLSPWHIYFYNSNGLSVVPQHRNHGNLLGIIVQSNDTIVHISDSSKIESFDYCRRMLVSSCYFDLERTEGCAKFIEHNGTFIAYGINRFEQYDYDEDKIIWRVKEMPRPQNTEGGIVLVSFS